MSYDTSSILFSLLSLITYFFPLCSVPVCHQDHGCPIRGRQWVLQAHRTEETLLFALGSPIRQWRPTAKGPPPLNNTCNSSSNSSKRYRTETGSECHKLNKFGIIWDTPRDVSMATSAWLLPRLQRRKPLLQQRLKHVPVSAGVRQRRLIRRWPGNNRAFSSTAV